MEKVSLIIFIGDLIINQSSRYLRIADEINKSTVNRKKRFLQIHYFLTSLLRLPKGSQLHIFFSKLAHKTNPMIPHVSKIFPGVKASRRSKEIPLSETLPMN